MKAQPLVTDFASKQGLNWKIDQDDDSTIIPGRTGHIYQWDDSLLAVMYLSDEGTAAKWNNAKHKCIAAGMTLLQDGETEGSLNFDPTRCEQARVAIKIANIKSKRKLSRQALERAKNRMAHARSVRQTQSTEQKIAVLTNQKAPGVLFPGAESECTRTAPGSLTANCITPKQSASQLWEAQ